MSTRRPPARQSALAPRKADEALAGSWIHAHEEDRENLQCYRPADTALPPSRGRRVLSFAASGQLLETRPGRGDVPETHKGSWRRDKGGLLELSWDKPESARIERWQLIESSPRRLLLKRL
jgi:hypothetical protein